MPTLDNLKDLKEQLKLAEEKEVEAPAVEEEEVEHEEPAEEGDGGKEEEKPAD